MQKDSTFWKVLICEYFCFISNTHPSETSLALDGKPTGPDLPARMAFFELESAEK